MNTQKDERLGRPSASSMERYVQCPGSWLLEQQVPLEERLSSKDAERGTRLHEANETGQVGHLALKEQDLIVRTRQTEERIYAQWCDEYQIRDAEIIRERRWWLRKGGKPLTSAKLDFVALSQQKKLALILDLKSGRKEVAPAPRNWQLRTGVVVLHANYSLVGARVGIVAPLQQTQPLADYTAEQLFVAWDQLEKTLADAEKPEAKRTPGTHCEFCPARAICPEAVGVVQQVAGLKGLTWSKLSAADKVNLFDLCKKATPIIKAIGENIKSELKANPDAIPGLTKKADQHPREISNITGIYNALLAAFPGNFKTEEFTAICGMSVGDLTDLVRKIGGKSEDEAEQWINSACADFIKKGFRAGSVERTK
jgi:hypothetical protein